MARQRSPNEFTGWGNAKSGSDIQSYLVAWPQSGAIISPMANGIRIGTHAQVDLRVPRSQNRNQTAMNDGDAAAGGFQELKTWIAFLRGINVGGRNRLPMRDLVEHLVQLGCDDIRTYIQSGNVLFQSEASKTQLLKLIPDTIEQHHGFRPSVALLTAKELTDAAKANPYPEAEASPKLLHLFFLHSSTTQDVDHLNAAKSDVECFTLRNRVLYMVTPDGFGRSKLARDADRRLGVRTTARNWRTVSKMIEMLGNS